MTAGKHIFKVEYHAGELFALVEAETPEAAVEIAKAHRLRKFGCSERLSTRPPQAVLDDTYTVIEATESDIAWCHKCRVGVLTGMPVEPDKGGLQPRKAVRAIRLPEDAERAEPAFPQAA